MKNILVTGGAGFIGSNFVHYMIRQHPEYNLVVFDKLTYAGNMSSLLDVSDEPRYKFVRGDIADRQAVEQTVREHQIDTIVNLAAESVAPNVIVPVHVGSGIRLLTIEDLFLTYARKSTVQIDANGAEIVEVKGRLMALAFKNGMGTWKPVTHITRHKYSGEMITLRQKWGEVTVTPNHSVYNAGGQLVAAATNPELLSIRKINLDRSRFRDYLEIKLDECALREDRRLYLRDKQAGPRDIWVLKEYRGEALKALMRFLGAYLSEGSASFNSANGSWQICISNSDASFLEQLQKDVALFSNATGYLLRRSRPNVNQLTFNAHILYRLVTDLCGQHAEQKRLPDQLYTLQDCYKQELLETYLLGDGNTERYKTVDSRRFTTVSPTLAAGLGMLLSLLALDYSVSYRDFSEHATWHPAYTFRIVSSYDTRTSLECERFDYTGYVYDLTVEDVHNFAAGIGNIVVHNTHVDRSILDPDSAHRTNFTGVYVLLEAARKFGIERFHQVSTDEVYGSIPVGFFKEGDPLAPNSPYSASKAGGELMVRAYHETYGLNTVVTRGSNTYGPYQYPEKVLPLFVTNAIDDEPLPLYGDGMQVRDWLYVEDHCSGIDLVLHKGEPGEVYNVGGGNEKHNIEVTRLVLRLLGKPESLIKRVTDRPGHDRRYALDCAKIKALGWQPARDFEAELAETVEWYKKNEWWWRPIKSGEFREYYQRQYGERLAQAEGG